MIWIKEPLIRHLKKVNYKEEYTEEEENFRSTNKENVSVIDHKLIHFNLPHSIKV